MPLLPMLQDFVSDGLEDEEVADDVCDEHSESSDDEVCILCPLAR